MACTIIALSLKYVPIYFNSFVNFILSNFTCAHTAATTLSCNNVLEHSWPQWLTGQSNSPSGGRHEGGTQTQPSDSWERQQPACQSDDTTAPRSPPRSPGSEWNRPYRSYNPWFTWQTWLSDSWECHQPIHHSDSTTEVPSSQSKWERQHPQKYYYPWFMRQWNSFQTLEDSYKWYNPWITWQTQPSHSWGCQQPLATGIINKALQLKIRNRGAQWHHP